MRELRQADDEDRTVVAELHVVPPVAEVALVGEVDLHTLDQLRAAFDLVERAAVQCLTVDVSAAEFLGIGALGAMSDTAHRLAHRSGRVTVVGARPVHRRVLELLGFPGSMVVHQRIDG